MPEAHLDSDRIAAYAERRLPAAERSEVEAHLAACVECRREASDIAITFGRDRRRRRLLVALPLAAAALLAVFVVTPPLSDVGRSDLGGLRPGADSEAEGLPRVEALAPAPDGEIGRDMIRFVWRPVGADALYRLVVTDSTGQTVWEGRGSDTALVLPASVRFHPGSFYYWLVDVLLPDARMATTGPQRFRITP
jgi:hypothetical protein